MQKTIWITGLSGAGKTTIGKEVASKLREKEKSVVYLDGDDLRAVFNLDHSQERNHKKGSRLALSKQYSNLCLALSKQELIVVIATISMFKEVHEWNRKNLPNYFEVYLKVPLKILRQRDPKNIYHRYDRGEIRNVAGLDLIVDEPSNPNLIFDYANREFKISEVAEHIILQNGI
jgi:adenylylsulfate kinase